METEQKPDIIKFLLGESDQGYWYGDTDKKRAPFWWRHYLRTHIEALQEENRRLKNDRDNATYQIMELENELERLKFNSRYQ